jgi:RsmE family RNA methyltransferase
MNVILFDSEEVSRPLPIYDHRAVHILHVLKISTGESFDVGMVNGPRGKARLLSVIENGLNFEFSWNKEVVPELFPVTLIVGLPRPQSARRILRESTALGVSIIFFVSTEKSEASYRRSKLWSHDRYRSYLKEGAQQAFCTRLPEVRLSDSMASCMASLPEPALRLALDNYEADIPLKDAPFLNGTACILAVGPERGWSKKERELLKVHRFHLIGLGTRVLRTETACTAGITLVLSGMNLI